MNKLAGTDGRLETVSSRSCAIRGHGGLGWPWLVGCGQVRVWTATEMSSSSAKKSIEALIPLRVRKLHGYIPGEQPKIKGLIKLNTNENPYPPSPKVLRAVRAAVDGRLRLYPDPSASALRRRLAELHECTPENIIVGNGSDELLALATRAFVEATGTDGSAPASTIQTFVPSYSLYPVLAAIHGAQLREIPLLTDFAFPAVRALRAGKIWRPNAALTLVTTPNAPAGRGYLTSMLRAFCAAHAGVVVLDEAYADFADENAAALALEFPHVLVCRTFSKAYSLCFQRMGYFIGHPVLIQALDKVRDSYNVNGLGQIAASATLDDLPYYQENLRKIRATRDGLFSDLTAAGFRCLPSQTNFIFAQPPRFPARSWAAKLRDEKILVRWFDTVQTRDFLRISVGTEEETRSLLRAVARILGRSR